MIEVRKGPVTYRFEPKPAPEKKKKIRKRGVAGKCWYCGVELVWDAGDPFQRTRDHQTPTSRGGEKSKRNKVTACASCNSEKGDRTLEEYRAFMQELTGKERWVFFREGNKELGRMEAFPDEDFDAS